MSWTVGQTQSLSVATVFQELRSSAEAIEHSSAPVTWFRWISQTAEAPEQMTRFLADSETVRGAAAYIDESVLCHLRLNGIVTFRMLLVSACLLLLTTTGLTALQVADSPQIPILVDTPEYAPLDENAPHFAGAELYADSNTTELCVLAGDASDKRKCEYYLCLEKLSCESPERFEDEETGNVAVVCR